MAFDLIKQMNNDIREKDAYEVALEEAGIEFDMGEEQFDDFDAVIDRLIDEYSQAGAKDMSQMSTDDLADKIGDDLEQLEFSPEQISSGIEQVLRGLGRTDDGMYDMPGEDDPRWENEEASAPTVSMEQFAKVIDGMRIEERGVDMGLYGQIGPEEVKIAYSYLKDGDMSAAVGHLLDGFAGQNGGSGYWEDFADMIEDELRDELS